MSQSKRSEWRRLCLDSVDVREKDEFSSLDLARGSDGVISALSREAVEDLDLDEFREFIDLDADPAPPMSRSFKEELRRELWWNMVSELGPYVDRIPQA